MPELLTPKEVATIRRCTPDYLAHERLRGVGIPYVKDGRRVLYRRDDVENFLNELPRKEPIP